jgi:hypothetical protein
VGGTFDFLDDTWDAGFLLAATLVVALDVLVFAQVAGGRHGGCWMSTETVARAAISTVDQSSRNLDLDSGPLSYISAFVLPSPYQVPMFSTFKSAELIEVDPVLAECDHGLRRVMSASTYSPGYLLICRPLPIKLQPTPPTPANSVYSVQLRTAASTVTGIYIEFVQLECFFLVQYSILYSDIFLAILPSPSVILMRSLKF